MLDFLPIGEKRFFKKEYKLRVVSIALILLFFLLISCALFLLPSYFLSKAKDAVAMGRNAPVLSQEDVLKSKSLKENIDATNEKLADLKINNVVLPFTTDVIDSVLRRPFEVHINSISYSEVSAGKGTLDITGVAGSRDAIVSYVKMLHGQRFFDNVDFPISNLAPDKNINFIIHATGTF